MRIYAQSNLLLAKIRLKKSNVRALRTEFYNLRSSFQQQINSIDYAHICSKFLKINNLKLKYYNVFQQKKFCNLLEEKRSTQYPKEGSHLQFLCKYVLSNWEKFLLTKSLNFSIPGKKSDYVDYLLQFELFFRDILNLDILSNEELDFVKAKTKEEALSSYGSFNNNVPENLSKEEFIALKNISKNKDLIIQKSDKSNSAVIVDMQDTKKMDDILSGYKKFSKVSLKHDTFLNFAINQEKHLHKVFKKLVESKV